MKLPELIAELNEIQQSEPTGLGVFAERSDDGHQYEVVGVENHYGRPVLLLQDVKDNG